MKGWKPTKHIKTTKTTQERQAIKRTKTIERSQTNFVGEKDWREKRAVAIKELNQAKQQNDINEQSD